MWDTLRIRLLVFQCLGYLSCLQSPCFCSLPLQVHHDLQFSPREGERHRPHHKMVQWSMTIAIAVVYSSWNSECPLNTKLTVLRQAEATAFELALDKYPRSHRRLVRLAFEVLELLLFYIRSTIINWQGAPHSQKHGTCFGYCLAPVLSCLYLAHLDRILQDRLATSYEVKIFDVLMIFYLLLTVHLHSFVKLQRTFLPLYKGAFSR